MPSIQIYIENLLKAQEASLLKLANEYGEKGNDVVIGSYIWLRPIITDFINMVKERHKYITSRLDEGLPLEKNITLASEAMLDEAIQIIVLAYPMTARSHVRGITSKIRNDIAIARMNAKGEANIEQRAEKIPPEEYEILKAITMNSEQFKTYCEQSYQNRILASYVVFHTNLLEEIVLTSIQNRLKINSDKISRVSDITSKNYLDKTVASNKVLFETYFDAFRRFWKTLPYGNLYIALAIKKLLNAPELLKKVIRYKVDLNELLFVYLPTMELRKIALQEILKLNYLNFNTVTNAIATLPEGNNLNWTIDLAEFGIQKYISLSETKYGKKWEASKKQIRAEIFRELLELYRHESVLEKKIIVYVLLEIDNTSLARFVCKAMGSHNPSRVQSQLLASIKHDVQILKIDIEELQSGIIQPLIVNIIEKKSLESREHEEILNQLHKLIPQYDITKSAF